MKKVHCLYEKHSVDAAIVLGVVCHLCILAPHNLATGCDQTKIGHVDLDDSSLRDDTKLRVHWTLRVLLHADNIQAERSGIRNQKKVTMKKVLKSLEQNKSVEQTSSARGV